MAQRVAAGIMPMASGPLALAATLPVKLVRCGNVLSGIGALDVRCMVAVPVAVIVTRALLPDATETIGIQVRAQIRDESKAHIHPAPADHEPVTLADSPLQRSRRVVIEREDSGILAG